MLKKMALQMLDKSKITPHKAGNVYYGNRSFTLPTLLNDGIYYFKFFPSANKPSIESDVTVVNYLIENGISLPSFFQQDGKQIFYGENENITFYASKFVDGDNSPVLSSTLIRDIVINIARMHSKLKTFDKSTINIEKLTDYQRMIELYIKNNCDCDSKGIGEYLEKILKIGTDNVPTYPIHSDLYMGNIKVQNGKFKSFMDFSDIRESFFEDDLGKFFQSVLMEDSIQPDDIANLIKVYESESGISLSKKNVYVSILYCMLDRYFNREHTIRDKQKMLSIVQELLEQLERDCVGNNEIDL